MDGGKAVARRAARYRRRWTGAVTGLPPVRLHDGQHGQAPGPPRVNGEPPHRRVRTWRCWIARSDPLVGADGGAGVALAARGGPADAVALALAVGRAQRVDAGARRLDVGELAPALLALRVDLDRDRRRLAVLAHEPPQHVGAAVV